MELAHAGDDRLAGLLVDSDPEGRVLLGQREQGLDSLSWSALVLGSTATWITGSGKVERLEHDRVARVAEGVAGGGLLEPTAATMSPGEGGVQVLPVVGVHLEEPPTRSLRSLASSARPTPLLRSPSTPAGR